MNTLIYKAKEVGTSYSKSIPYVNTNGDVPWVAYSSSMEGINDTGGKRMEAHNGDPAGHIARQVGDKTFTQQAYLKKRDTLAGCQKSRARHSGKNGSRCISGSEYPAVRYRSHGVAQEKIP